MRQLRLLGTALLLVTFGLIGVATSAEAGDAFAVDDEYTVMENSGPTLLTPDVTANDSGINPGIPFFAVSSANNGTVTSAGTPSLAHDFSYTPNSGFSGDDTFTYSFLGTDSVFHTATVTVHVTPLPTPKAVDDEYTVVEGSGANHLDPMVTANDVGVTQSLYQHSPASHGTVTAAMFSFDYTYTPEPGFSGDDSFTYTFLGTDGQFHEGTVTIHVTPATVVAAPDEYTVAENSGPNHLDPIVTANDVGVTQSMFQYSRASHGNVEAPFLTFDFTYTPDPDFHGDDSFTYIFMGIDGVAHEATVTIHVTPAPGPYAMDDEFTVAQDSGTTVLSPDVTSNDFGFSSALFGNTPAAYGIVTTTGGQESHDYAYKPDAGFYGDDTFTYTFYVGDDPHPRTATVTIHVIRSVTAKADNKTMNEDAAPNPVTGNVLTNDTATSGTLSVTNPGTYDLGHGTLVIQSDGSYSYTLDNSDPAVDALNNGQSLTDSFTYNVSNGQGSTDSAALKISIKGNTDTTPVEFIVTGSQTFGGSPSFIFTSSIPGLTATGVTCTTVNPGSVAISPTLPVGSSYTLAGCTGTVDAPGYAPTFTGGNFTVSPDTSAVTASDDANSMIEDSAPNPVTGNVLTNDTATSGTLSVTNPGTYDLGQGTLVLNADGAYTYTLDNSDPMVNGLNDGFWLLNSFTYNTSNGQGSTDSAQLTVTINGKTDATPVEFTVTGSQTFGGSPSFMYSSSVPGVTASGVTCTKVNPGAVTISSSLPVGSYTLAGCTGTVDAAGYAPTFTGGAFDVDPDPTAVTAVADAKSVEEDSAPNPVTGNVLTNDSATSGTLSVTNAGTVSLDHGTLVLHADGSYTYTLDNSDPAVNALNTGQSLTDSFTYNVSNGQGSTGSAALKITINGSTDAPALPAKKVEVDTDSSATVGHTITVKVTKLAAGEPYTVDIGGIEVKTGKADSKGKATFKVVVPLTLPAGQTLIRVVGQAANRTDSDRITIKLPGKLDVDLGHSTVKPGKTQTVKVSNLIPGEEVIVSYDDVDLTLGHADSSGKFTFSFPVGTTEGPHTVMVSGHFGNRTATKTFKVKR